MSTTDFSAIRLDRSRPIQTVHGDRIPGDPHYNVHFYQGGLPFDAQGNLVPPDHQRPAPWNGRDNDGKPIVHHPLYTEQMHKILDAKMKRAAGLKPKDEEPEDGKGGDDDVPVDLSEEVNLEAWLRGAAKYEPHLIYAACKKRYGRNFTRLREVVEELVYDLKLVPEPEVASSVLAHLNG